MRLDSDFAVYQCWLKRMLSAWLIVLSSWFVGAGADERQPRVAIWDPQVGTAETRFKIDCRALDRTERILAAAGCLTVRVTSDDVDGKDSFNADRFDAFLLYGESVPRRNIPALKKFADAGGVIVVLGTSGRAPLVIAIERQEAGWTYSPSEPR